MSETAASHTPELVGAARERFPVLDHLAYLNAGTFGPLSRATSAAMREEQERDLADGRSGLDYFLGTLDLREDVRRALAGLVGVDAASVALTSSTTEACNVVLAGLGLRTGDEVVTTTDEHFGLLGALGASPATVVVAPPEADAILETVTSRTRLIAVSEVLWTTGVVLPVGEIRRRAGVPVLVDGAQSVGAIGTTAADVDYFTISGQKWLCGPDATGALVVHDVERLRVASPSFFSQASFEPDGTFVPRDGAQRFERQWWSRASLRGLQTALAERPAWATDRALEMTVRCRELLGTIAEVFDGGPSTLVAFRPPAGDAAALVARLHAVGVRVREIPGRELVRVSVGWWTSEDDLDRLVAGITST